MFTSSELLLIGLSVSSYIERTKRMSIYSNTKDAVEFLEKDLGDLHKKVTELHGKTMEKEFNKKIGV